MEVRLARTHLPCSEGRPSSSGAAELPESMACQPQEVRWHWRMRPWPPEHRAVRWRMAVTSEQRDVLAYSHGCVGWSSSLVSRGNFS